MTSIRPTIINLQDWTTSHLQITWGWNKINFKYTEEMTNEHSNSLIFWQLTWIILALWFLFSFEFLTWPVLVPTSIFLGIISVEYGQVTFLKLPTVLLKGQLHVFWKLSINRFRCTCIYRDVFFNPYIWFGISNWNPLRTTRTVVSCLVFAPVTDCNNERVYLYVKIYPLLYNIFISIVYTYMYIKYFFKIQENNKINDRK